MPFARSAKLEFPGIRITSDGDLLLYREMDEVLGLTVFAGDAIQDPRTGQGPQHTMTALLRQAVFGRLAGYGDTHDSERSRVDPALRQIAGGRAQ